MILKKLKVKNIRSYKTADIEFSKGKTLIKGDIGSGKSSIMLAIEMALFGTDIKQHIRKTEDDATIELEFEIKNSEGNNETYSITRNVNRKKGQLQGEIIYPDGKKETWSPTELSAEIMKILEINEIVEKKQGIPEVFRATVSTRQEELKFILQGNVERRLSTLSKAFEIESYKNAIEKAKEISLEIKKKIIGKQAITKNIPELKKKNEERKNQIVEKKIKKEEMKKELDLKRETKDAETKEYESIKEQRNQIIQIKGSIQSKMEKKQEKLKRIGINDNEIKNIKEELGDIENIKKKINSLPTSTTELENKKQEINKEVNLLNEKKGEKDMSINSYKNLSQKHKCDICGREISDADTSEYHNLIHATEKQKNDIVIKLKNYDEEHKKIETEITEIHKSSGLKNKIEQITKNEGENITLKEEVKVLENEIEVEEINLNRLPNQELLEKTKKSADRAVDEFDKVRMELRDIDNDIERDGREREEKERELKKLMDEKTEIERMQEIIDWLNDYFIRTVEIIEDQVLSSINEKFNDQFKEWFYMLVDDKSKTVWINEEFTPVIEEMKHAQEYKNISGGEKASVALAYRLALNSLVRQQPTGFRPELLMLDEPTDGFSKELRTKTSNILLGIDNEQVIIVSHELEFEKFEQIIRVTKENNVSDIQISY